MHLLRWVYHNRNLLAAPPLVLALFSEWHETEADWVVWPVGLALVVAGVALRVWAQSHILFRVGVPRHLETISKGS